MTDVEIRQAMNDVHNNFWIRWRDNVPDKDSGDWDIIVSEAGDLMKEYSYCPLVVHNVCDLIGELDDRMRRREDGSQ